jgi:hypothetical protein
MNLPEGAGIGELEATGKQLGIGPHTTDRESNPAHFFVKSLAFQNPASARQCPPGGHPLPPKTALKTPLCPFSIQGRGKTDAENPQVNR